MKKTVIKRGTTINAPKHKVWEALADFGNVQRLSPNIAKSYLTSDAPNGLGATRHCDFTAMGAQVEEKIIEWNEGNLLRIQIYDPKNMPMVMGMEALFELKEQDDRTELTGTFEYGMTGVFGGLINNLAMKKMNEKAWVKFIAGIKHGVETGDYVDKKTNLDLSMIEKR